MKPQAFQHPEIRDENDNIIKPGAFGKNSAFFNATNDGVGDYIFNDLEWLYERANADDITAKKLSVTGASTLSTVNADDITTAKLSATGESTAPTAPVGNKSKTIANTEFVQNELKQNNITNEYKSIWSLCTKNENVAVASIRVLNFCVNIAIWTGENKAHDADDLLFTLPAEYLPKDEQRVPFTGQNNKVSGIVKIARDGKVTVFSVSSTTIADRITFNCMYFI